MFCTVSSTLSPRATKYILNCMGQRRKQSIRLFLFSLCFSVTDWPGDEEKTRFACIHRLLKDLLPCSITYHGLPWFTAYERYYLTFKKATVFIYRTLNNISWRMHKEGGLPKFQTRRSRAAQNANILCFWWDIRILFSSVLIQSQSDRQDFFKRYK